MNVRDLIDRARSGDDYACGALYAICDGDPVKLTELGEDIATAVNDAHDRAIARTGFRPARKEPTNDAWREYARLVQARLDRNADTTDYDNEWTRPTTDREHATARRLGLPYPTRLDVDHR